MKKYLLLILFAGCPIARASNSISSLISDAERYNCEVGRVSTPNVRRGMCFVLRDTMPQCGLND